MTELVQSAYAAESKIGVWSFGNDPESVHLTADSPFDPAAGFGFEPGTSVRIETAKDGGAYGTSDKPIFFSVMEAEGNYNVTVEFVGIGGSKPTVKAEVRRLMLEAVDVPDGSVVSKTFTVNVRHNESLRLKKGEADTRSWDDRLTLEFSGPKPAIRNIKIEPAPSTPTVFIAGDSTVTDQPGEPYNSWGQMLPRWLKPGVAVANYAWSGESLKSFLASKKLAKIESLLKPGDYLFIQFGHNDQKDKSADAGAFKSYTTLLKQFAETARAKGATAVLVTPVSRRHFAGDKIDNNLGDFPDAVRKLAADENIALVDLNKLSIQFYEAMGPAASAQAFAKDRTQDNTHHNSYGSYEISKCVINGIMAAKLGLAKFIVEDWKEFDPAHPDPIDAFDVPAEPHATPATKPEGS